MAILKPGLKIIGMVLSLFLLAEVAYALLLRPWVIHWGATDPETRMAMPGDSRIKSASVVSTRAITIHASVSKVWPWVAQLSQERGGFYSYTFFENVFGARMVNADTILPAGGWLKVGDRFAYGPYGLPGTYGIVDMVEPEHVLDVDGWCFLIQPVDTQTTRLIVRYPFQPGDTPIGKIIYYGMFEQAHFIMETGMMMGIKQRAESNVRGK